MGKIDRRLGGDGRLRCLVVERLVRTDGAWTDRRWGGGSPPRALLLCMLSGAVARVHTCAAVAAAAP